MSQRLELVSSGGNLVLDESEIVAKYLDKMHTGVGAARVDVPQNDAIIDFVQRQDRANYYVDDEVVFTGRLKGYQGDEKSGMWTLRIDGIGTRLEETRPDYDALGGSLVYTNTRLDDAIEDYWSRTPFSATVTEQTPELISEDELLQDVDTTTEWQNNITIADDEPLTVRNGNLELEQIAWTAEGEDQDNSSAGTTAFSNSIYSNGVGRGFNSSVSSAGDFLEWTFTPEHDIPAESVGVRVRDFESNDELPGVTWTLNGNEIDSYPQGAGLLLGWRNVGDGDISNGPGYTGGDLQAGQTYTLRVEVDAITSGQTYVVDVVAPYDERYSVTFDNSVDGNGYLSGPELYPDSLTRELASVDTAYNISAANLTTTFDDITNNQRIGVSNDGGTTYDRADNSNTLTTTFAGSGRTAVVELRLSRYGSRTTATPTTGYLGQTVGSVELRVDLTNLVVIDRLELSRDHFANLKQLHDYGDYLWVIEHDSGDLDTLSVSSFARGQETRTSPPEFSDVENIKPEVAAENYFNSVYLEGALQDDGTRPTATVKSDSAIATDGREITPGVLRDQSISTESGAQFRANALLAAALENNALRGGIETTPVYVQPGFSYSVDFGEGDTEKTLESVSITESAGSVQATYEFVTRQELSNTLDDLKREGRTIGNEV